MNGSRVQAYLVGAKHELVEDKELLLIFLRKEFPATYLPETGKEQSQEVNWIWVQILILQSFCVTLNEWFIFPQLQLPNM